MKNVDPKALVKIFNGEISLENTDPLAMVYAGHQFGNWVPQLGDGRGILFGQIKTSNGLKRAGKTLIQDLEMVEPFFDHPLESIYVAKQCMA